MEKIDDVEDKFRILVSVKWKIMQCINYQRKHVRVVGEFPSVLFIQGSVPQDEKGF